MFTLTGLVRLSLGILILLLATDNTSAQQDDPVLRERFLKGVSQAARKLDNLSFRAKCRRTSQLTSVSEELGADYAKRGEDPKELDVLEFECVIRGSDTLKTGLRPTGLEYVEARNSAYVFAIRRPPGSRQASLEYVEQLGVSLKVDALVANRELWARGSALAAFYLWDMSLSRAVNNSDFHIHRVSTSPSKTGELVRVEFSNVTRDADNNPETTYSDCFLICDPAKEWAITEYGGTLHTHVNDGLGVQHVVLKFGESVGGVPIAIRLERTDRDPNDPGTVSQMISVIDIIDSEVPKEEFSLSYYGLPEPNFEQSWYGSWLMYLMGGAACLAVAYGLRRRRRAVG